MKRSLRNYGSLILVREDDGTAWGREGYDIILQILERKSLK